MNSLHKKIIYILQKHFFDKVLINEFELSKLDNDDANYLIKRSKISMQKNSIFCKKLLDLGVISFAEVLKPDIDRSKTKQERYKIKKKTSGKVICSFYVDKSLRDDFSFLCAYGFNGLSVGEVLTRLMRDEIKKNQRVFSTFSHLKT